MVRGLIGIDLDRAKMANLRLKKLVCNFGKNNDTNCFSGCNKRRVILLAKLQVALSRETTNELTPCKNESITESKLEWNATRDRYSPVFNSWFLQF